jgi:hypothetical protein
MIATLKAPADMTDKQLLREGQKIIDGFWKAAQGDPYGWDWPTMFVLYPEKVERFRELKAEWRLRHPLPPVA